MRVQVRIVDVDTSRADRRFVKILRRSRDFKPVFRWVFQELQKAHRDNFRTGGATSGFPWKPLEPQYASWKIENYGANGVLVRTGDLRSSLTMNSGRGAVRDMGARTAEFGTKLPYAQFHQSGTSNMAQRKPLFLPKLMADQTAHVVGEYLVHGSVGVKATGGLI
jgi:phage gpG-like protein|tara:strand:- start:141 stop:635 length:495 start_codon:yes stop_codon:yes gene_type:complete